MIEEVIQQNHHATVLAVTQRARECGHLMTLQFVVHAAPVLIISFARCVLCERTFFVTSDILSTAGVGEALTTPCTSVVRVPWRTHD